MRALLTGSSGNLSRGLLPRLQNEGWIVRCADCQPGDPGAEFHLRDLRRADQWAGLCDDCDVVVHAAAWHGIHSSQKDETEFWELNVGSTFHLFQEARRAGVRAVVFLSSQAWHQHFRKYGFTKRVGEELCRYHLQNHGISHVAVRPYDFTPWTSYLEHGAGLLYGRVEREDVIDCVLACMNHLTNVTEPSGFVVNAVRANAYSDEDLDGWEEDPVESCERVFPGSSRLVQKYDLKIHQHPMVMDLASNPAEIDWHPIRHFGTFLHDLDRLDQEIGREGIQAMKCPFAVDPHRPQ